MEMNDRRLYFMINLHEGMGWAGIKLATPRSAVRLASVARHVTDCAARPGTKITYLQAFTIIIIFLFFMIMGSIVILGSIRGSSMRPKWLKLVSRVQKTCTFYTFSSLLCSFRFFSKNIL